jgi:predicted porin
MKNLIMLGVLAVAGVEPALAVDIKAGDWTVGVGGMINAYYTVVSCTGDAVGGLALAGKGLGCGGQDHRTTIGNGLLPNELLTSATSRHGDYDVKALIGIYNATATDSALGQNSVVDVRQVFFTFGNAEIGTVKLGRDYGIFGINAILGDMTLLGAGAPAQAFQRGRVALGHIGAGYTYPGNYGQIVYSTPKFASGFGADIGVMSPVADTPVVAGSAYSARSSPQMQAQLTLAMGRFKGWLGAKSQKFKPLAAGAGDLTMRGLEVGASWQEGPTALLANVQRGTGLGILADADQGDTKSTNYLIQGTYKASAQLKLGLNYGSNENDDATPGTRGLKWNTNLTVGAYYTLNKVITLVGEVGQTHSRAFSGASARMNGVAVGGTISF